MTLRELLWAANAKEQAAWVRGACLTAALANANSFSGKIDPAKLVPECYRDEGGTRERPRTAEEEAIESEMAWRLLGQGLGM